MLLRKGRQTFPELLRNTNSGKRTSRQLHLASSSNAGDQQGPTMTAGQLKQVLLVLIQQNCIITRQQPAEKVFTGVKQAVHLYEAHLQQMLQLIRCAKQTCSTATAARNITNTIWHCMCQQPCVQAPVGTSVIHVSAAVC